MFYIGCLPLLAFVLLLVVLSLVRSVLNTSVNVLYGLYLTIKEKIVALFQPTPTESDIDNINYYRETEERPKYYDKEDGEYVSFKETKNK